jgi:RNA 3'-terminal phosphate cyclase (ATP)
MQSIDHSDVRVDGSQGEGGGQIVRSSLVLSMVTGRPVVIENIRAGREKPGLMRQHLTALQAAARISDAQVTGAEIGSRSLTFQPGAVRPGEYAFSIGTAGSATLVLQTVLPALLIADGPSSLTLEGGTHNQWAPPFDFLQRAYLPLINRMGPRVTATLERHGFYPAGGGRFAVTIEPSPTLAGFDLLDRGEIHSRTATALVANLPRHIAEREIDTILRRMNWDKTCGHIEEVTAHGPGNVLFATLESEQVTELFTAFGRIGIRAEQVARELVRQVRDYLKTDAPVGPHLADQLLLPLGISAWQPRNGTGHQGGSFRTLPLTRHATTHIEILRRFLEIHIEVTENSERGTVTVALSRCPFDSPPQ